MKEFIDELIKAIPTSLYRFFIGLTVIVGLLMLYVFVSKIEDWIEDIDQRRRKYDRVLTDEDYIENDDLTSAEFLSKREMTPVEREMKAYRGLRLVKVEHGLKRTEENKKLGITRLNDIIYTYMFEYSDKESIVFDNIMQTININSSCIDIKLLELLHKRTQELGWNSETWRDWNQTYEA